VVPVLAAADALVLPSRTEGIPAVVIEAGLAGLPVVASAVGGIPEVVVDGETGALVTPGDEVGLAEAITRALAHAGTLGPAGRERCRRRFELTPVAAAWGALLDEMVAPGGWWPRSRERR
jgi:glycosyltransferase involved in cell wall biosynthesis